MSNFCERLKDVRLEHGMSVREFAEALNTSNGTISKYENNVHSPSIEFVKQVALTFFVSIDWLVGISDKKNLYKK
jgi:transcriptional regulator with XRE-family HTH domain